MKNHPPLLKIGSWVTTILLLSSLGGGCGYSLQGSRVPELEKVGVRRIYIAPLVNNSYKSGVENLVYNALLKALSSNRWLVLVREPQDADAVLQGVVNVAQFSLSGSVPGDKLNPVGNVSATRFSSITVATEYTSQLGCAFTLVRRSPLVLPRDAAAAAAPKFVKSPILWSANFSRSKPFPASNQLGTLGETSALINDSEFDRTLGEMSQSMMADVRESLLSRF